jgi:hypothetical protein
MSKVIIKQDNSQDKKLSGWDKIIADAQKGIERLKRTIEACHAKKKAGEPWPTDTSTQN